MSLRRLLGVVSFFCQIVLRSTLVLSPLVLTTTARPDEVSAPQWILERDHSSPPPHRGAASTSSHTTTLVYRRLGPRISTQAIVGIVVCSAVVFCALVGCLLQLHASVSTWWHRRGRPQTPTSTQNTLSSADLPDAEMGDQPVPMATLVSPPPPYSRAPSYESTGGSSTSRRNACAP